jgi:lauroyl/myristoyl acyltransferase
LFLSRYSGIFVRHILFSAKIKLTQRAARGVLRATSWGSRTVMLYWIHVISSWLLRFVPARLAYAIVGWLAPLFSRFWGQQYRQALANMERVLGPRPDELEVRRQVRNVFRNYARYMVDLLRLPLTEPDDMEQKFRVYGFEHIEEALERGRGLVMVTAHIGNWDMAGALLAARGYPVNVIVETLQPRRWNDLVQKIRALTGMRAIPLEGGVRQMIGALRKNEILAVLIDRPLADEGVPVRFFDSTTRVPGGAATLALRAGSNVVAAAAVRAGDGFVAHISPLIEVEPTGNPDRDVQAITQGAMSWLEALIRRHPDQWYMFRDMWPEAAAS